MPVCEYHHLNANRHKYKAIDVESRSLPEVVDDFLNWIVTEQFDVVSVPNGLYKLGPVWSALVELRYIKDLKRHLLYISLCIEQAFLDLFRLPYYVRVEDTIGLLSRLRNFILICCPNFLLHRWYVDSFVLPHSLVKIVTDSRQLVIDTLDDSLDQIWRRVE